MPSETVKGGLRLRDDARAIREIRNHALKVCSGPSGRCYVEDAMPLLVALLDALEDESGMSVREAVDDGESAIYAAHDEFCLSSHNCKCYAYARILASLTNTEGDDG